MTKIERRKATVKLYSGDYASRLDVLREQTRSALLAEESGTAPRRAGTKSKANQYARAHDALLAEAEAAAVEVEVHEISNTAWQQLADDHPPREDEARDKQQGLNMKTFPGALLRAALVGTDIDLGELSRAHYVKLETAAWNLHNGDDVIPKLSLVSLLKQQRDPDSRQPNDSE